MLDFTKGSVTTPESEQKGDERDDGRKGRGRFRRKAALRTVGMIVAAAVCAGLWSTVTEATNASAAPVPGAFKALTADIDGDGRDDIVWNQVVQGLNRTYVGLGKADGTLQYLPPQDNRSGADWRGYTVDVGDVNGDGRDDVIWNSVGSGYNITYVGLGNPALRVLWGCDLV